MDRPEIKLPPEVASLAKRTDVRMIAGAALGGLALGLYVGIKLAGPRAFVPHASEPVPCADCAEKAEAAPAPVTVAAPAPAPTVATMSEEDITALQAALASQVAYPVIPPPLPDTVPVDG